MSTSQICYALKPDLQWEKLMYFHAFSAVDLQAQCAGQRVGQRPTSRPAGQGPQLRHVPEPDLQP
eukprot:3959765-Alexandrium_andersonii.AAC.1